MLCKLVHPYIDTTNKQDIRIWQWKKNHGRDEVYQSGLPSHKTLGRGRSPGILLVTGVQVALFGCLYWRISICFVLASVASIMLMRVLALLQTSFVEAALDNLYGRFGQPPLPKRGYKLCIYRGGFQTAPTNQFVEAAGVISRPYNGVSSRPYKSICRGGCSTSRPYNTCL